MRRFAICILASYLSALYPFLIGKSDAQIIDCTILPSPPNPPCCVLETNIPHFQYLCSLPHLDTPLLEYANFTINQLCDGDCRCFMGATARGGQCKTVLGKDPTLKYCVCDYNMTPVIPPTFGIENQALICAVPAIALQLCVDGNIGGNLCNSDCICSHGYGNTLQHHCTSQNGNSSNTQKYCVCQNAINVE